MINGTYVIADIHGRYDLLVAALHMIDGDSGGKGKVVVLGDFVDRGPDSAKVVERLMSLDDAVVLQGNHEAMMLQTLHMPTAELVRWWIGNGGGATMLSYGHPPQGVFEPRHVPSRHRQWLASLPSYYEDEHRVYVHGGVPSHKRVQDVGVESRQWFLYPEGEDEPNVSGKHIVHGHEQSDKHPLLLQHRTNLDAHAYKTGRLAIGVFDGPGGPRRILWAEVPLKR